MLVTRQLLPVHGLYTQSLWQDIILLRTGYPRHTIQCGEIEGCACSVAELWGTGGDAGDRQVAAQPGHAIKCRVQCALQRPVDIFPLHSRHTDLLCCLQTWEASSSLVVVCY